MRRLSSLVLLVVVAGIGAACSSQGIQSAPLPSPSAPLTSPSTPAPAEFTNRVSLQSCGEATPRGPLPAMNERFPSPAIDCLIAGQNGDGGEFVLRTFTTDGEPVVTYFRVLPGSSEVEVFVDDSKDKFRGGAGTGWSRFTCPVPDLSRESLIGCMRLY
jgi:hypothetical protein